MDHRIFDGSLEKLTHGEAREILDKKAQQMKDSVINTPSYIPKNERVIYVSNSGCDQNDGLTIETPIATLAKVNEITRPGDTILFKRGDHFRGHVTVDKDGVTYASYGDEAIKPIIDSSSRNYADPTIWNETDKKNVYVLSLEVNNVGLMHFDPSYTYGAYNDMHGTMKMRGKDGFMSYADLASDLEFFSDREDNKVYLYSDKGNPGDRFADIEFGEGGNTFGGSAHNVTFDGLWIMHTGSHGIGSGTTVNRVIRNCIFSWLGGSMLGAPKNENGSYNLTRFGNAVEIYGGCEGFTVENNWMYQIYDTAITHQYGHYSPGDCIQHDVLYRGNLMEYCFWYIEFYDGEREGTTREVKNVYMTDNYCRMGGYGWGCPGRAHVTPFIWGAEVCKELSNFVIEKNVFYHTLGQMVHLPDNPGARNIELHTNVYVQEKGYQLGDIFGKHYKFDDNVKQTLAELVHEETPIVVFMPHPKYTY